MVQLNEFYRLLKKCNECQKRRLMSIIWKMKCSHIVGPSPNRNHYHHSEVKKRQELSVDPEYRMSDDAAKIYHFTTCRKLSTQRGNDIQQRQMAPQSFSDGGNGVRKPVMRMIKGRTKIWRRQWFVFHERQVNPDVVCQSRVQHFGGHSQVTTVVMWYHHLSVVTHLLLVVLVVEVLVVMRLVVPKWMHHAFFHHLFPAMK